MTAPAHGEGHWSRPFFTVDASLRIVGWPDAAARAAKKPSGSALGRRCWSVLRAERDPCPSCPLTAPDHVASRSPCQVIPLRARSGALVSPREWRSGARRLGGDGLDLSVIGALAVTLDPADLAVSSAHALEVLRWALGADDAELFLAEPLHRELVMVACVGADREAFEQRLRFAPGSGYPGAACESSRAQATRSLPGDRRFIRASVAQRGVKSYGCVPVIGSAGPIGAIGLAWRRADVALEHALEMLEHAAPVVGSNVEAGLARARALVRQSLTREDGAVTEGLASALAGAAHARRASVVSPDRGDDGEPGWGCVRSCPHLARGRARVLDGGRTEWPRPCRQLPAWIEAPCCLPVPITARTERAFAVVDYGSALPSPPTRDVVLLMNMAHEGGRVIEERETARISTTIGPELRMRCFGPFELSLGGRCFARNEFTRKHAITLLRLLVLRAGAPIERAALADRLWPGCDERSGANRLHGVVHALRSVLEPRASTRGWTFVKSEGELYWFDVESSHRVDLYEFRERMNVAGAAERAGRIDQAIAALEEATALYRGDLFSDAWESPLFLVERSDYRQRFLAACGRAAALLSDRGDHEGAARHLRRALEADPLREDLHQALIRVLLDAGRRRDAMEQYRLCESVLQQELGTQPLPATVELARRATTRARLPA